jgi:hypothetical protein
MGRRQLRQAMGGCDDVPSLRKRGGRKGPLHPFGFLVRGLGNLPSTTNPRPPSLTAMTARVTVSASNGGEVLRHVSNGKSLSGSAR